MVGVIDRVLFMWQPGFTLPGLHRGIEETLGKEWALRTQELVGSAAEFALEAALWFFERFQ